MNKMNRQLESSSLETCDAARQKMAWHLNTNNMQFIS